MKNRNYIRSNTIYNITWKGFITFLKYSDIFKHKFTISEFREAICRFYNIPSLFQIEYSYPLHFKKSKFFKNSESYQRVFGLSYLFNKLIDKSMFVLVGYTDDNNRVFRLNNVVKFK